MTPQQQEAWKFLGWNENSWNGIEDAPLSDSAHWNQLTSEQQSAAKYGLGYDSKSWDDELNGISHNSNNNNSVQFSKENHSSISNVKDQSNKKSSGILSSIFGVFSGGAEIINHGIDVAKDPISGIKDIADTITTERIEIASTEAILYLDNSVSMTNGSNLKLAHQAFESILPQFNNIPTRVVVFGSYKDEIVVRDKNIPKIPILPHWDGNGGGTYLWHMIDRDIVKRYKPSKGTLRVYVITDGGDIESPYPYYGPKGMNPLMENLLKSNYRIEWTIIVIGMDDHDKINHLYKDLCLATGGSFLSLNMKNTKYSQNTIDFIQKNPKVSKFVLDIKKAHGNDIKAKTRVKEENQAEFNRRLKQGTGEKFTWLEALPPPQKQ
mmetsp:Transcript_23750/g.27934  ORF Transcript_23750/g.27934 Transcript_23750/m.27934 type:complete len:380 (+) Transcript_23750:2-1141(+)|eukprot:CAMPEP_0114346290 /NCGR_PEP_ID=MMETSP0101-20121206/12934_1 /TAXON_ID=38822 ORGANISM="Pteridomonas danica, Strain PT" /NCGR_SAMPLE_ID=MMETSP0101 /ASSEMBLY_ACC=CAM_ASM_000211 /LENGTH=379 /DNA_ID=CAMNT_0001482815 /DNA_START=234 /DNA_END=1373 /DNA_ORIENTATION=+